MKRLVLLTVVVVFALSALSFAEGLPSTKATADISTLVKCTMTTAQADDDPTILPASCVDLYTGATVATDRQWIQIMEKPMKLSNSQSLFVTPSLVTGLYTRTRTKTTTGSTSTAIAMGAVYLKAQLVDAAGNVIVAAPLTACADGILGCENLGTPGSKDWGVLLNSRIQSLTQELSECVIDVTSIEGTNDGTCTFTSTIDLLLNTTSAHSFGFIFPSVGQGTYKVQVWAAVGSGAEVIGSGTAVGSAAFGLGSMQVESVRLVHDFSF